MNKVCTCTTIARSPECCMYLHLAPQSPGPKEMVVLAPQSLGPQRVVCTSITIARSPKSWTFIKVTKTSETREFFDQHYFMCGDIYHRLSEADASGFQESRIQMFTRKSWRDDSVFITISISRREWLFEEFINVKCFLCREALLSD